MPAIILSLDPAGGSTPLRPIRVTIAEGRNGRHFTLTYRGETIPLEHSASLNRWAATGIVRRHNIAVSHVGVTIDARTILFTDANAGDELEKLFNEVMAPARPIPNAGTRLAPAGAAPADHSSEQAKFAQSVKVTRDGFEFHVSYLTKFGEHRTEKLEKALETLQKLRAFKPHVNMQKAGVRIVATSWDGESFLEQPGIENIEHATPEQVEALIKSNLEGSAEDSTAPAVTMAAPGRHPVVRLELAHRPHDPRLHLVLHRNDGSKDEGPVFIRANLAKLHAEGLFQPEIHLDITAMNDRLFIDRTGQVEGKPVQREEAFRLETDEEIRKAEAALNDCLLVRSPAAMSPN